MNNPKNSAQFKTAERANNPRAGFTLVELMVAVALVLLMMLMFTEIFQILSGAMSTQRGISENDQRERLLVTVLQSDLDHRTFQYLQPYSTIPTFVSTGIAKEDPRQPEFHYHDRRGYFYISENDPNNDTDDLLQFTVSRFSDPSQEDQTEGFYYGHANIDPFYGTFNQYIPNQYRILSKNPNQPDADDGRIEDYDRSGNLKLDFTSQSSAAEVSYFLRGGNLYRRVLLIREPLNLSDINTTQPTASDGTPFFVRGGTPPLYGESIDTLCNFWRDLDFSAYYLDPNNPSDLGYAHFHDLGNLENYDGPFTALGKPQFRFGFDHATGLSREFIPSSVTPNPMLFMGRFTHEETSHVHFNYPHDAMDSSIGGGGNPMDPAGPSLELNPETRVIDELSRGVRRSEDLVLSNVRSFDIKVFDDLAGTFVDLGSSSAVRFAESEKQNTVHGNSEFKNVFDTWHPAASSVGGDLDPPFPMLTDPATGNPVYDVSTELPRPVSSPLSAIRILIRYEDPTSGQLRQMTLIHPLRNKGEG